MDFVKGFSKLSREEKTSLLAKNTGLQREDLETIEASLQQPGAFEEILSGLSENYIANHMLPFGIAPNFRVNDKSYFVPMVTEESSVVAAAAYAAKFWSARGGFKSTILGTKKSGHIYFSWKGSWDQLNENFETLKPRLERAAEPSLSNMLKRGGGLVGLTLLPEEKDYYTIQADFETVDSMGANLINTCLETMGLELLVSLQEIYPEQNEPPEIIMAILSNYTPECMVECTVECGIEELEEISAGLEPQRFANKFATAVQIAIDNPSRAVTHNKGIFNGIDALLVATGNDFRAAEANAHAYASSTGKYKALSKIRIDDKLFSYTIRLPLALGTVGGITSVHPLVKTALKILQDPSAEELMQIAAAVGLASNFAAIRSLVTDGIQKGHMKLHIDNILTQIACTVDERGRVKEAFKDRGVSFVAVNEYLRSIRES